MIYKSQTMYKETNNLANPFERKETGEKEISYLIHKVNVSYFQDYLKTGRLFQCKTAKDYFVFCGPNRQKKQQVCKISKLYKSIL